MESESRVTAKKHAQVTVEEKLEEVDLGIDPQKPRPISISLKLSKKEKEELILLLKEFKDVFAWDYSEMPGLDTGLVVHTLNVGGTHTQRRSRVFYIEIEEQIL